MVWLGNLYMLLFHRRFQLNIKNVNVNENVVEVNLVLDIKLLARKGVAEGLEVLGEAVC